MKFIFIAIIALISTFSIAQPQDPTSWSTKVEKLSDTEYKLITEVTINPGWHVYSQALLEGDEGPLPTEFMFFNTSGNYELVGMNKEIEPYSEYTEVWGFNVYQFSNSARFEQIIKLKNSTLPYIIAEATFMVCDDQQCLPPTPEALVFKIDANANPDAVSLIEGFYDNEAETVKATGPLAKDIKKKSTEKTENVKDKNDVTAAIDTDSQGMLTIFLLAFGAGLLALLTPCVFPMIPLTVSYFTKYASSRAKGIRDAIIYGVSIIFIYVILGSIVVAIFGSEALSELSTSAIFNLIFFAILLVFAISFLGAFEITLPQSWANKADSQAGKGGLVGVFFMALALAIVSFSCTGPLVGSLLVQSAQQGGLAPVIGMLGFSTAIALPFTLFAIFPSWLTSLPKSGGWMTTVKVTLGFLELALAFKFLSNADLVMQWHILEREVFLAIWIAVFGVLGLYLLGKIRLKYDDANTSISVGRLLLAVVVLIFTVYLIPGLWGAPLKVISGFPPPSFYSESPNGLGTAAIPNTLEELPEGASLGPHNLVAFDDYETGLTYAKEQDKNVLIDFTGWACVNCRRMEANVWSDPTIMSLLKNDLVLISLYVDEKTKLPESEQVKSKVSGKKLRTVGNKWSDLQLSRYQVNAQPYYVLQTPDGADLENSQPVGYTPDIKVFTKWLEKGKK